MAGGDELNFRVSPRVLGPLGLEQLQDPALAVLELVKNAWDANATTVAIDIISKGKQSPRISVSDNGDGMTRSDFRDRWLVIGASHKRGVTRRVKDRPLIGEKGLGRLASYALGTELQITSKGRAGHGFSASINWDELLQANSVEEYKVQLRRGARAKGTKVVITNLKAHWNQENTDFLITHAQFLTSVPGQRFRIGLKVDGVAYAIQDPIKAISGISEADLEMVVLPSGVPKIERCVVGGIDFSKLPFRSFKTQLIDQRLGGTRLSLNFYRRDAAIRKLSGVLASNEANDVLERYQGIRIYRDGINVPPYGLGGNDWAALEKQRTATGGPTMVPGNSQLTGELKIPASAKQFVITAGRSGFSDQSAVKSVAEYVRWAVRELGTARRAAALGLDADIEAVPTRVDAGKREGDTGKNDVKNALDAVLGDADVKKNARLRKRVDEAKAAVEEVFDRNEATLRLYAQLASTGIAATSFAHELRTDFDVVSSALAEIDEQEEIDQEVLDMLGESWGRITNFVSLFKLLPVKVRRQRKVVTPKMLTASVEAVLKLAPAERVKVQIEVLNHRVYIVPAELDSILLNLVTNAVKAIAESTRANQGRIRVVMVARDKNLEIRVADNGCGIEKKVLRTMFEPLEGSFAEGTGMGLPIVKFIVERYKGSIIVNSAISAGFSTEFRVVLKGVVR